MKKAYPFSRVRFRLSKKSVGLFRQPEQCLAFLSASQAKKQPLRGANACCRRLFAGIRFNTKGLPPPRTPPAKRNAFSPNRGIDSLKRTRFHGYAFLSALSQRLFRQQLLPEIPEVGSPQQPAAQIPGGPQVLAGALVVSRPVEAVGPADQIDPQVRRVQLHQAGQIPDVAAVAVGGSRRGAAGPEYKDIVRGQLQGGGQAAVQLRRLPQPLIAVGLQDIQPPVRGLL